jgi:hypothetical protein
MVLGNLLQNRILCHASIQGAALSERAVGHKRRLMFSEPGLKVKFRAPASDMIQNLIGLTVIAVWNTVQFFHVIGIEVGYTPAADHSVSDKLLHAGNGFRKRDAAAPVKKIQIKIRCSEPLQGLLTAVKNPVPAGIPRVYFGDQCELFPRIRRNGFSDKFFRSTFPVHLSGIDQCHIMFDSPAQGFDLG